MNARLLEIKKIIKDNGGEKKYLDDAGGFFAISYCDVIKIIKETEEQEAELKFMRDTMQSIRI